MKILIALTYYRPHISGLTIYVERLATALAVRGHSVTVLTSRYDPALPAQELIDGVRIVRAPVWMRISKGVIMPGFGDIARALLRDRDTYVRPRAEIAARFDIEQTVTLYERLFEDMIEGA